MTDQTRRIGRYTLVRKLGEGGMGVVYLAQDPSFAPVALKVLKPDLAGGDDFRRRFTREVEAARQVARFCTAPVLDAGIEGTTAYLVTEYVEGPDLAAMIGTRGPMTGANLEALAVGVATALAAIHEAGVVHRDLKPANILLSAVGPRVIDFGIARIVDPDATQSATVTGTPAYMAPEQVNGGQVTAASDVFAWGGVVTYAGTGRPPFGSGAVPEVLYRVAHHVPDLDGLDERLRPLVEQALHKDPDRRPSADDLLARLLGRERATVASATRAVSDAWTPLLTTPAPQTPPTGPAGPDGPAGLAGLVGPAEPAGPGGLSGQAGPGGPAGPARTAGPGGPAGPNGTAAAPRRASRWAAPVLSAVLASALTAGGTLALWRPWEGDTSKAPSVMLTAFETVTVGPTSGGQAGTPQTKTFAPGGGITPGTDEAAVTFRHTNSRGASVPGLVQIDSLAWQGDNLRLEFTIRNDGAREYITMYEFFTENTGSSSQITVLLPDETFPIKPMWVDDKCACSTWGAADQIRAGESKRIFAVFRGIPKTVKAVDLDLLTLGLFRNVKITQK